MVDVANYNKELFNNFFQLTSVNPIHIQPVISIRQFIGDDLQLKYLLLEHVLGGHFHLGIITLIEHPVTYHIGLVPVHRLSVPAVRLIDNRRGYIATQLVGDVLPEVLGGLHLVLDVTDETIEAGAGGGGRADVLLLLVLPAVRHLVVAAGGCGGSITLATTVLVVVFAESRGAAALKYL